MLHHLMWEYCWSLKASKCYVYSSPTVRLLSLYNNIPRHGRHADQMPWAPIVLSPPPCRCWRGGPSGRTCKRESYSSCQAPSCHLPRMRVSRRCHSSQMNCCSHNTWTNGKVSNGEFWWLAKNTLYIETYCTKSALCTPTHYDTIILDKNTEE